MTLTNHMLTGALIGAVVDNHWVAIPAALVSHLVLDIMPHYGFEGPREMFRKRFTSFWFVTVFDAAFVTILSCLLLFIADRTDLFGYAVLAASPDFIWIYMFARGTFKAGAYKNRLIRFLKDIQVLESPAAVAVDISYGVLIAYILYITI